MSKDNEDNIEDIEEVEKKEDEESDFVIEDDDEEDDGIVKDTGAKPPTLNKGLERIEEKFKDSMGVPKTEEEKEEEASKEEEKAKEDKQKKDDIKKLHEEAVASKDKEPEDPDREKTTEELYPTMDRNEDEIVYALRTTANREDQVMDFVYSNAAKKKLRVYSVIRPHGMRGYIFLEAASRYDAEQAAYNIPYARGILPKVVYYSEIEHMLEQVKREVNIQKNDIVEIISGPFKREKAKITRIDQGKEEVVVELLEAAVPIPITLKLDTVKVIRRDSDSEVGDI